MDLTVTEAATLLGVPARTLRGQLTRGDLPGRREGGRWVLASQDLPLNEAQRARLQGRANANREAVEEALPSRLAPRQGHPGRSVADNDVYRAVRPVFDAVRARAAADARWTPAAETLRGVLLDVAEATSHFDADIKRSGLLRARGGLGRAVGLLLIEGADPPDEPVQSWVIALESHALPMLAGLIRWTERLTRRPR